MNTLDVKEALRLADKARGEKSATRDIRSLQPPVIAILAPLSGSKQKEAKLVMTYQAKSKAGAITSIEAKIDGRPANILNHIPSYGKDKKSVIGQITLEIPPEDVTVTLIAKNQNGASEAAKYRVNWEGTRDFYKPKLYVLAIGVTRYADEQNNTLDYPQKMPKIFWPPSSGRKAGSTKKSPPVF